MKAVGLFSGGLDSCLAIKLIQEQGIEVTAFSLVTPFFGKSENLQKSAAELGVKFIIQYSEKDYFKIVSNPKHGHGKNMNPCVDCKIFILKRAKKLAKQIGAEFVFTGEVLGQRPMSQQLSQLKIIEKESGLKGRLLRPLCAKLLEPTLVEKKGFVDREQLMDIQGRSRGLQIKMAERYGLINYTSPAGGCLLTCEDYSAKLADLIKHKEFSITNVNLLKKGRHFRFNGTRIIVGRNMEDNSSLKKLKGKYDYLFEAEGVVGPVTLLSGKKSKENIEFAASLTILYSDASLDNCEVNYGKNMEKRIYAKKIPREESEKYRITTKFKKGVKY